MGTSGAEQEMETVFTCHHIQRLQFLLVRKNSDVGSRSPPSSPYPLPELLYHSYLSMTGGAVLGLAPAPGYRTASQPPHTEVLAVEPALLTIMSILATAGLQRQSQAGVTPLPQHITTTLAVAAAASSCLPFPHCLLPLTAHKRAGSICWQHLNLCHPLCGQCTRHQ